MRGFKVHIEITCQNLKKNWRFIIQESNRRNDVPEIGGRTRRRQWSALRGRRLRRNNLPQNHRGLWSGNLSFDIVVGHPCIMKDLGKMCQEKGFIYRVYHEFRHTIDKWSELVVIRSLLNTFEVSGIFRNGWATSKNWLEPQPKQPPCQFKLFQISDMHCIIWASLSFLCSPLKQN